MSLNSRYSRAADADWKPATDTKGASTETCWMTYPDTNGAAADVSLEGFLDIYLVRVSVRK
jgi:hypothetical protein